MTEPVSPKHPPAPAGEAVHGVPDPPLPFTGGYGLPKAAEARVLAEVEALYGRERAAREAMLPGLAAAPAGQGGT